MICYNKPVSQLIAQRRSWRSYTGQPLRDETKNRLREVISHLEPPPFGSTMRFSLIDTDFPGHKRMKGTYGVIRGASTFLAGALLPGDMSFEDFGYTMESLILFVTSLGLGSCWIGGTLRRSYFGEKMDLKSGEIIPAITPVGHVAARRSLVDSVIVLSAGSQNRKPMHDLCFEDDFDTPMDMHKAGEYAQPLEMVRRAPSASNNQPWRIVRKDGMFHLYLCRSPGYRALTGDVDMQRIDMGIAMFHFHSCAHERGLAGRWEITDPGISSLRKNTYYCASWVPQK